MNDKKKIYCQICGKYLLKIKAGSEIDIRCERCSSDISICYQEKVISSFEVPSNKG